MIAFYQTAFEEGNGVYAPSPCWINGYLGNSPACEDTWPAPWALPIRGWATYDLTSQQVAQTSTVQITVSSISPNWGNIGSNVNVTISGSGFGTSATVGFGGTGITASINTANDSTITGTFNIAANAPLGVQDVIVTNAATNASGAVSFEVTPVRAVPVNFHMTGASDQGQGADPFLEADFAWQSSSGDYYDIGDCFVREYVTFPNTNNASCPAPNNTQNCFYPPSPPWVAKGAAGSGIPNPSVTSPGINAAAEEQSDYDRLGNLNFVKPYSVNSWSGTQLYQYSCAGGAWTNIYGPVSITYTMSKNASGKWVVTVSRGDTSQTSPYTIPNQ